MDFISAVLHRVPAVYMNPMRKIGGLWGVLEGVLLGGFQGAVGSSTATPNPPLRTLITFITFISHHFTKYTWGKGGK